MPITTKSDFREAVWVALDDAHDMDVSLGDYADSVADRVWPDLADAEERAEKAEAVRDRLGQCFASELMQRWEEEKRAEAAEAENAKLKADAEALAEALSGARDELERMLGDLGCCDHAVGICHCDVRDLLNAAERALHAYRTGSARAGGTKGKGGWRCRVCSMHVPAGWRHDCGGKLKRSRNVEMPGDPNLPEPDADGWIKHDGGPCPVDWDTMVRVRFRDGLEADPKPAGLWSENSPDCLWRHRAGDSDNDIIAYRIVGERTND
ncbi:MAG: hypothetical protein ACQEUZ_06325 [Pseudomonadota bacterium]